MQCGYIVLQTIEASRRHSEKNMTGRWLCVLLYYSFKGHYYRHSSHNNFVNTQTTKLNCENSKFIPRNLSTFNSATNTIIQGATKRGKHENPRIRNGLQLIRLYSSARAGLVGRGGCMIKSDNMTRLYSITWVSLKGDHASVWPNDYTVLKYVSGM